MSTRRQRLDALAASRADASAFLSAPPERWQHGQDVVGRGAAKRPTSVASGVQALRKAKCIGDAEVTAAERFHRDYVFGVEGVRDPLRGGLAGAGDLHDVMLARAAAITAHREIADVIGPKLTAWLVALIVSDLSFVAMQTRFMPGPLAGRIEMKGRMTTVLLLLSRLYAAIDRRRGSVSA
jgi:hypothetical protein